jgi:hypothetical protein
MRGATGAWAGDVPSATGGSTGDVRGTAAGSTGDVPGTAGGSSGDVRSAAAGSTAGVRGAAGGWAGCGSGASVVGAASGNAGFDRAPLPRAGRTPRAAKGWLADRRNHRGAGSGTSRRYCSLGVLSSVGRTAPPGSGIGWVGGSVSPCWSAGEAFLVVASSFGRSHSGSDEVGGLR